MILTVYCACIPCIIIICVCTVSKIYPLPSYLIVLQSDPGHGSAGSPACSGSPTELTGPSGELGISSSQYKNNLQCGWKIRVESSQVIKGSLPPVFIFRFYCADLTKQIRTKLIIIAALSFNSPRGHSYSQISSWDSSQEGPYPTGVEVEMSTQGSRYGFRISRGWLLLGVNN